MKTLRERPTFNDMIYSLYHQPIFKYPARKGIRAINDPIISNLLFDNIVDVGLKEKW